jgi:hypothetical protein
MASGQEPPEQRIVLGTRDRERIAVPMALAQALA